MKLKPWKVRIGVASEAPVSSKENLYKKAPFAT